MVKPWIVPDDLDIPSTEYDAEAIAAASQILFELSGRRYGGVRNVRETYRQLTPREARGLPIPVLERGRVYNVDGTCLNCGCSHAIKLRGTPVIDIISVSEGSTVIPVLSPRVLDFSWLTMDPSIANSCWGTCKDITVVYTYGTAPPPLGKMAARELAKQFILYATDSDECKIPERVTSVSREGVSWTLLDPQDFLEDGRTGIYAVDMFLKTVNPERRRMRARVFTPDGKSGKTWRT